MLVISLKIVESANIYQRQKNCMKQGFFSKYSIFVSASFDFFALSRLVRSIIVRKFCIPVVSSFHQTPLKLINNYFPKF